MQTSLLQMVVSDKLGMNDESGTKNSGKNVRKSD